MANSSVAELKDALRDTLDRNGSLGGLKARLRQEIFKALNETNVMPKPEMPNENLIINELIREYLIYNNLRETLSVFLPETGQPLTRPFDRSFLDQGVTAMTAKDYAATIKHAQARLHVLCTTALQAEHLNVVDGPNARQLPLLYSLTATVSKPPQSETGPQEGMSSPNT